MTFVKRGVYLWLAVLAGCWLLWDVPGKAGSAEPDPFTSLGLERFAEPVSLPEMSLPDLEGKNVALRSFKGQVVLMNFWTTW